MLYEYLKGIEVQSDNNWVLEVNNNTYGQRQSGRVWNKFRVGKLTISAVRFRKSKIDECVFYWGEIMYVIYTDYSITVVIDKE